MFSSNQILEVSGSLDQIETALKFALEFSGYMKNLTQSEYDRGCRLVFQVTEDGKYCIGWGFKDVPNGWTEYQFRPDISIISAIIKQRMEDAPIKDDGWDGSYHHGFIMKKIDYNTPGVENEHYGIVYFEPFTTFYHK